VSEFGAEKLGRDGLKTKCKTCMRDHSRDWRENNPNWSAEHNRRYKAAHPDRDKEYYQNNKHVHIANSAKRRAAKLQRSIGWADLDKIKEVYVDCVEISLAAKAAGCSDKFVVDHIVPLQGKLVSGLHVEYNLQIITSTENSSKGNKFIPG